MGAEQELARIAQALADFLPLPGEALCLGVAADGLPVLLDLHDPAPGPILLVAGSGGGKTEFLRHLALAVEVAHTPGQVQYGVLTGRPEEWRSCVPLPTCAGVFDPCSAQGQALLYGLRTWCARERPGGGSVLLLLDGLEQAALLPARARSWLSWVLRFGPARRVWPVATLGADAGDGAHAWLGYFATRIFGSPPAEGMYALREGERWLRFGLSGVPRAIDA